MLTLVFLALFQPAEFKINLESNTEVIIFQDGEQLQSGQIYRTQPILGKQTIEIELRWVEGETIKTQIFDILVVPGKRKAYDIKIEVSRKPIQRIT